MDLVCHDFPGLTPELVARFISARERFQTISGESSTSAATIPGGGTPAGVAGSSSRLTALGEASDDLFERLARLATTEPPEGRPPLETYTVTPAEHGDVVRATPEYVRWFLRTYPAAGPENRARVQAPGPDPEGYGAGGVTF